MVKFVVDSTFGITREYAQRHGIRVVSLTLLLDGKEYSEGYEGEWDEFYDSYAKSKSPAKTSQPSPQAFANAASEIYAEDEDNGVVILTIGDRLSGTVSSANLAAQQFKEQGKKIAVIDSHNAACSAQLVLRKLVEYAESGATFDQVVEYAYDVRDRAFVLFIPARLTELARGGRVNKLVSTIGNLLNIKPIFEFKKNEVHIPVKALGLNRAIKQALSILPKNLECLAAAYICNNENVHLVQERLASDCGFVNPEVIAVSPVLGAHIGIGAVGITGIAEKI